MMDIEAIATDVVDCAIKVHKALGPGLLESAYQHCHAYELKKRGWDAETEIKLPLIYEGQKIHVSHKIDTLINKLVIVENKFVESLLPIHAAQLLTYMKLSGANSVPSQLECTADETWHKTFRPQPARRKPLPQEVTPCLILKAFAFFAPGRLRP